MTGIPQEGLASSFSPSGKMTKKPRIMVAGVTRMPRGRPRRLKRAAMKKAGVKLHAMTDILELVKILRGKALLSAEEANSVSSQVSKR